MTSKESPTFQIPLELDGLGIPATLAEQIFARRLFVEEVSSIRAISERICVSVSVGQQIAESLRAKKQLEYLGSEGRDYRVKLTGAGSSRIGDLMKAASYVVPVPVSLEDYQFAVERQTTEVKLDRATIKAHLSDIIVPDALLDQLGPSFLSNGAIFLYGPPGTGKTSLAERIGRFADDDVLIPRIVETDNQLISVYDPSIHKANETQPAGLDPRWVVCKRPVVMVGGELQLDSLDIQHDELSGLHTAPLQMLANNGILIVDDFGRQTSKPEEILNRWILPLSTGIDYLKGRNGTKFWVPFELKLVVSTNLEPSDLGDEAFLRRLQNKIFVGPMQEKAFIWTLARAADRLGLVLSAETASQVVAVSRKNLNELRPYIAVDFCEMARSILDYDEAEPILTADVIDRIADIYFVKTDRSDPGHSVAQPATAADSLDALGREAKNLEQEMQTAPAPQRQDESRLSANFRQ